MGLFDSGFESLDPLMTAVNAGRIARRTRPQTRQPEDEYTDEEIEDVPQKPMPEVEPGILRKTGEAALGGIGAVGNFLDLPGSMVRDVATWLPGGPKPANPFDQLLSPFSGDHRTSGRDLLRGYGLAGEKDSWGNFAGGLGAEIALDPLTYVGVGLASRAGNVAKKANLTKNVTQKVNQAAEKVAKAAGKEAPKKLGWLQARSQATPSVLIHESDDPAAALAKFYEVGGTDAMLDKPINTLLNASIPFAQWIPYLKKSKYSGTAELVGKKALVHPDDAITAARQQRQADALFSKYAPQQSAAANAMDAAGDLADDATSSTPNPTPVNPTPQPQVQPQVQPQPQPQPTTPQPQPTTQGVGGVNDGGAFDTATYLKQVVRPSDDQHMIDLARELMNSAAGRNGGAFTHKQLMDEIDAAIDEGLPPGDASTLGAMFQRAQQLVPNKKNLAKKGKGKKTAPTTPSQPAQETPEIPTSSGDPGSPTVELDYDSEFGSRPATDGVNQDILDNLTPMTDSIGEGFVKSDADRKYLADRNFVLNPAKKRYERQYGVKKNEITPENPDISGQNPAIGQTQETQAIPENTANSGGTPEVSGQQPDISGHRSFEDIESGRPKVTGVTPNQWIDVQPGIKEYTLDRPGQASARAQLATLGDGTARIDVTDFAKAEGAPKGSGKAALRELADTAKEHGATAISGNFTTHSALGALGSEFGKHNIRFFDKESGNLLDIDFAEAMKNPGKYIAEADLTKPKEFAPTKALPGTRAHAEVMKQRAELGLPLQHPDDAKPLAGSTYIQQFAQSLAEGKDKYHARQEALAAHLTAKGLKSTWQDINNRWASHHLDNLADDATDDEILRAFEASTGADAKIPGEHWLNKEPTVHGIQQVEKSRKEAAEFADRLDRDAEVLQALGSKQADGLRKQAEKARQLIAKSHDLEADVRARQAEEAAKIKAERDEILRWKDEPQTTASTETALANAIDDRNVLEDTGLYTNGHMVLKVPEKTRQTLLTKSVSRGAVNEAERASAAKLIQDHLEKAKALASQPAADVLGHRKQSFTETSRSGKVASVDVHSTLLRSGKEATAINTKYHLAIQKMFKGATYHFKNADGPIAIVHKGEVVGSIMPLGLEMDDATKTAMSRVKQAAPGVAKSKGKVSDARVTKDIPPGAAAEAMNPDPLNALGKQEPFAPVVTDGKLNSPATTINFEAISPAHAAYQKNVLNPLLKAKVLTDGDVAFLQTVLSQSDMRLIDPSLSATKLTPKIASKAGAVMDGLQGVYDNTLKQIGVNPKKHADHTRPEILLHETGHHIFRQLEATDPELYQKALDALLDGITNGTLFKYFKRTGKNVEYFLSHEHEAFAQLFANISAGKIKPDSLPSYLMDAVRKVWSKLIDYARLVIGSSAAGSPQLKTLEKIVEYAGGYIPKSERDEILNALKGNAPAIRANTDIKPPNINLMKSHGLIDDQHEYLRALRNEDYEKAYEITERYSERGPIDWATSSADEVVPSLQPADKRLLSVFMPLGDDLRSNLPASSQLRSMSLKERLAALSETHPDSHAASTQGFGQSFAKNMGGAMDGDFSGLEKFYGDGLDAEFVNEVFTQDIGDTLRDALSQAGKGTDARKAILGFASDMARGLDAQFGDESRVLAEIKTEVAKDSKRAGDIITGILGNYLPGHLVRAADFTAEKLKAKYGSMSREAQEAVRKIIAPIIDSINSVDGSRLVDELEPDWNMSRQGRDVEFMRIPKLGEMLQSPQAQGLRQSFTNWLKNLPDGFADGISDAVAKGENIVQAIPGVKEAVAAFDYAVMGARSLSGQSHARLVMERMEKARANVRKAIAPLVRAMEGTSFFDEAHIAQEMGVSAEQAKQIANTRSMNLKGFVEAINPVFYDINEMPAEVKEIAWQIQQMFADTLAFEAKEAGLSIAELHEQYAAYAARMARKPGKSYSRNPLSGPQVDTTFPAMQGRKSFLKNLPAGTMVIDQLSIDPKISGIVQRAAVVAKNLKRTKQFVENAAVPTKEQLRTYLFENYGPQLRPEYYDRMLKNIDPAAPNWQEAWKVTKEQLAEEAKKHDEVVKGLSESLKTADETAAEGIRTALKEAKDEAKRLNPAENEQFDELINWLSNLDPAYVNEQSPIFGRNILHDTMQRMQDGQTAAHVTLGAQKYLGESLRRGATPEDQGYDFNKLFSDLKMDSAQARQNVIRHMAEEYRDEHATMLEETTQEVLEQIEDLLGSPNDKDTTIKAFSHQVMDSTPDHLAGVRRGGIGRKMDDLKFVHKADGSVTIRQGKGDEAFDYDMDKLLEDVEHLADEEGIDPLEYLVREMVRQDVDKKFLGLHNAPKEVYDDMTRWMKPFTNPDEIEWWRNGLNRFMNIFRGSTTAPFPSFHVRNFVSGQAQNFFFHAYDPTVPLYDSYAKPIRDAWTMRNGEPIKNIHKDLKGLVRDEDVKAYQDFQLRTWKRTLDLQMKNPGVKPEAIESTRRIIKEIEDMDFKDERILDTVATRKLADEIFANGLIGSKQGQAAEIVGDTTSLLKSQMPGIHTNNPVRGIGKMLRGKFSEGAMEFSPAPPGTSTLDALTPTAFDGGWTLTGKESNADMFILARWGRDFGSLVEDMNRISPYLAFRKQGYTAEAAAEMVNKIQIDYTKLSNFERRHMRTMIPFWTFSSRALQMTAEDLIKHPGGKQAQTIRAINLMRDKETPTPEYIQNSLSIPLGELSDGSKRYITGFGLPLEDSTKFAKFLTGDVGGGLKEIGGRLNPLIKYPIESAMGRSMFYDGPNGPQELSELDPTLGRTISNVSDLMTGERTERPSPFISRGFEHVFANSPFARYGTFARQVTDPRKWEAPLGAALDLGTGIKVKDVSPAAQDTIATQRAAKLFKELGGRNQEIPYFPKDKIEKLSPEDKATVESIQGLLDTVRERRKLRREMQEAKIPTAR